MNERWKPERDETYYFMRANGTVGHSTWQNGPTDTNLFEQGNCFYNRDKAQSAAEKVKALLLSLHETATECSQLPKLTAEVFNRPDCPEWAQYAAVDKDGNGFYYRNKPKNKENKKWSLFGVGDYRHVGKFDPSDWQNSRIERPAKLLDWCKFGAVGWHKRAGYFKVCADDELAQRISIQQIDDKSRGWLSYETLCTEVRQAHLRPYNSEEMQSLVGKTIKHNENGDCELVLSFHADNNSVETRSWLMMEDTLLREYTINGRPCGVLEHMENGEWVQ